MESVYSTYEAKTKFSELLRKVRQGGRVVITFHGEPVAEIRPIEKLGRDARRAALPDSNAKARSRRRRSHQQEESGNRSLTDPAPCRRFLDDRD